MNTICEICFLDIVDCKVTHRCPESHIVCFTCLLTLSKDKNYLSCFCGNQVCYCNMNIPNDYMEKTIKLYLEFYERKYKESFIKIDGKELSKYFAFYQEKELNLLLEKINVLTERYSDKLQNIIGKREENEIFTIKKFRVDNIRIPPINCVVENCKGIINYDNKCTICNTEICNKCDSLVHEGECNQDISNSIKLMNNDVNFSVCPSCRIRIKREKGCSNVVCQCGFAFNIKTVKKNYYWRNNLRNQIIYRKYSNGKKYKKDSFCEFMRLCVIPDEHEFCIEGCHDNKKHRAIGIFYREFTRQICKLISRS